MERRVGYLEAAAGARVEADHLHPGVPDVLVRLDDAPGHHQEGDLAAQGVVPGPGREALDHGFVGGLDVACMCTVYVYVDLFLHI